MLCENYGQESLHDMFIPYEQWKPFPQARDRKAWDSLLKYPLNRERRAFLCGISEELRNKPWPELRASDFMDFVREGNRVNYEKPFFARRRNLSLLVIAECMEHRGRFLDEIINGIWHILEEITWTVNAHTYRTPLNSGQDPLPPPGDDTLALFSIQTAALLAETDYLLARELEQISPALRARIHDKIEDRIIRPFEHHTFESQEPRDLCISGWMDGHNNWTPWCCTNLLTAAMHAVKDMDRLCAVTFKLMKGADSFIQGYGPDGGCDEGPAYWNKAGGSLIRFLELLYSRSDGAVDIFDEPLIKEMGLYLPRMHLAGPWFANFADAPPKPGVPRTVTYRYGERVNSPRMQALVIHSMKDMNGTVYPPIQPQILMYMLRELFWLPAELPEIEYTHETKVWLPDLQVMVSRDSEQDGSGLVLAAKGGHNHESHNHNDLGQFIIFSNGTPCIIDAGSETYSRATFSEERYTLWPQRSLGHNVPCVNGWEQAAGEEFKATHVEYGSDAGKRSLSVHLEKAYPEDAGITSLERLIEHHLAGSPCIRLLDRAELEKGPVNLLVPLFTPLTPREEDKGKIVLAKDSERCLAITFNPDTVKCQISVKVLEDAKMRSQWGPNLHRIEFLSISESTHADLELTFTP